MTTFTRSQCRTNAVARQAAFSLIELLIVVTIIMILAGLLLPALRGVRERAKAISCMANLRDIGVSLLLYEQDYNGFPAGQKTVWGLGGMQGSILSGGCCDDGTCVLTDERSINRMSSNTGAAHKPYRGFRCPSDRFDEQYCASGGSSWIAAGSSYCYVQGNRGDFGTELGGLWDPSTGRGFRRAGIVAPARKVAVVEPQFLCNRDRTLETNKRHYFKSSSNVAGNPDFPMSNVLFIDGSVRYVARIGTCNSGSPDPAKDWY